MKKISIITFTIFLSSCNNEPKSYQSQDKIYQVLEKQNKILIEQNQIMKDRNSIANKHNEILEIVFKNKLDSALYIPFNEQQ